VVVVGNITVGGTGKTPLVIRLAGWLGEEGLRPGIVSRGYGGRHGSPVPVRPDSDPLEAGDEPVLLARRTGCPVWVGRRRAEAARQLLAFHPEVDVILSDDGLQHYALGRDVEVVVIDGERGFGNGRLLPAGPLREPVARLERVDAVVAHGGWHGPALPVPRFDMQLQGRVFWSLPEPERVAEADAFAGRPVHAVAGIGHPGRFFAHLDALGLEVIPRAFPDHHPYRREELPEGTLLMTEKDAVKCAAFGLRDAWALRVDAEVGAGLKTLILDRIRRRHGPETP